MGINTPSEIIADLSIGPTDQGMVRIYITSEEIDLPMDFRLMRLKKFLENYLPPYP